MPKAKAGVGRVGLAVLAVLAAGCSTQARKVDCDGPLRPINVPAPSAVVPEPAVEGQSP